MAKDKQQQLTDLYQKAFDAAQADTSFISPFQVYVELFFRAFLGINTKSSSYPLKRSIFTNLLNEWIAASKTFDYQSFKKEFDLRLKAKGWHKYTIYFGIPVRLRRGTKLPFDKSISANGLVFTQKTYDQIKRAEKGSILKEILDSYISDRHKQSDIQSALMRGFVFFQVRTSAPDESIAINSALDTFSTISACINVGQERNIYTQHYGPTMTPSRAAMVRPKYLILAPNHTYTTDAPSEINAKNDLFLMADPDKVTAYRQYLAICRLKKPTPIEGRIKSFILEFSQALDVADANLRTLAFWRCIEIALKTKPRTEKEMVDILSHFYINDDWKYRGELILNARNGYVHEGLEQSFDTSDLYLGWLQEYASRALALMLWMRDNGIGKKSTTDIDIFYDLYPKGALGSEVAQKMARGRK